MNKCLSADVQHQTLCIYIMSVIYWGEAWVKFPDSGKFRKFVWAFNFRLLFPHGPEDRSISRNIKKQCSDFSLFINLPLEFPFCLSAHFCFPWVQSECFTLAMIQYSRDTMGFESYMVEVPFQIPPFITMGESCMLSWGLSMISQSSTFVSCASIFQKMCSFKSLEAVASEETFISSLTSFVLYPFSILLSGGG